ncbi:hypothetical protein [Chondromyces crocatus]|uniref:Uncharacterized protein n=1 Tax=Chondromyces crocatus TaxID=52 RepID=A0A0K1EMP0_CHOCO|nr:hypothetical protein [Chondromyces crocatus]AKT41912.1 uncharacterized protein CMC5_061340 [Chondromyces crocatus]
MRTTPRFLRASFVRIQGQRGRIYVHRSDGSEVSWVFPSAGAFLPHDLFHLVAEGAFGLRAGFWGRVDGGADPARINDEANRMSGPERYRGFGDDRRELLQAEALVGALWSGNERTPAERVEAIVVACAGFGVAPPASLGEARVVAALRGLQHLDPAWKMLLPKGTIVLPFDVDDPQRGFDAWLANTVGGSP